jgi:hypothetical protein
MTHTIGFALSGRSQTERTPVIGAGYDPEIENTEGLVEDTEYRFWVLTDGEFQWGPHAEPRDTYFRRAAPGVLETDGDFRVGGRLSVGESGVVTLIAGVAEVASERVTNDSRILLTHQNASGTPGWIGVSSRDEGVSFTITGQSGDTSDVAWLIVEPV